MMKVIPDQMIEWDDYFGAYAHLSQLGFEKPPKEFILTDQEQDTHMVYDVTHTMDVGTHLQCYSEYRDNDPDSLIRIRLYH